MQSCIKLLSSIVLFLLSSYAVSQTGNIDFARITYFCSSESEPFSTYLVNFRPRDGASTAEQAEQEVNDYYTLSDASCKLLEEAINRYDYDRETLTEEAISSKEIMENTRKMIEESMKNRQNDLAGDENDLWRKGINQRDVITFVIRSNSLPAADNAGFNVKGNLTKQLLIAAIAASIPAYLVWGSSGVLAFFMVPIITGFYNTGYMTAFSNHFDEIGDYLAAKGGKLAQIALWLGYTVVEAAPKESISQDASL